MFTIEDMTTMILTTLPEITHVIMIGCYIAGSSLIVFGIIKTRVLIWPIDTNQQAADPHLLRTIIIMILSGAGLIFFPHTIEAGTQTFIGTGDIMSYDISNSYYGAQDAIYAWIKVLGIVAVTRSLVLFNSKPRQGTPLPISMALTLFFGGIACINMETIATQLFSLIDLSSHDAHICWVSAMALAMILFSVAMLVDLFDAITGRNPNADKAERKQCNDE